MSTATYDLALRQYLANLGIYLTNHTGVIYTFKRVYISRQEDGYNCGVAVCYLMYLITTGYYDMSELPEKIDYAKERVTICQQMIKHVNYQLL
jgi:hypothetical protein